MQHKLAGVNGVFAAFVGGVLQNAATVSPMNLLNRALMIRACLGHGHHSAQG
jgi:hypothetical protein